jgi:hypothetical protein
MRVRRESAMAMAIYFRDAHLVNRLVLVGLAGVSRSGKTLTALRIAHGIVSVTGGKIAGVDTEAGRMLEYGPGAQPFGFNFKYGQLDAPFTGEAYLEALLEAEKLVGPGGVIVIDSISHEHEGTGGVLEQHEEIVEKLGAKNTMTAWARAKTGRKKLIGYIRSERKCHLVMCFRAERKTGVLPDGKPVDMGIQLIGWQGWRFEMSLFVMLNREKRGTEIEHDTTAGLDQLLPDGQITEATGVALAKWAAGGEKAAGTSSAAADTSATAPERQASKPAASKPAAARAADISRAPSDSSEDVTAARKLYASIKRAPDLTTLAELDEQSRELIPRLEPKIRDDIGKVFAERLAELRRSEPEQAQPSIEDPDPAAVVDTIDREGIEPEEWREPAQEGLL